jgi:hypothetical protein
VDAYEIVQFLRDRQRPFTPNEIWKAISELDPEGKADVGELTQEVTEEGLRWTMTVLTGLWEVLKAPSPPGVEEYLREGGKVQVTYVSSKEEEREKEYLWVMMTSPKRRPDSGLNLSPPELPLEYFFFEASTGFAQIAANHLHATGHRAFFRGEREDVEGALREAEVLRPILSVMGLGDLEGTIEKLARLEDGEVRAEGPYVLVRGGNTWALRRGTLLGDLQLDGAFLLGEEVKLSSGEVEVALKPKWFWGKVGLEYVRFRFGEEEVIFDDQGDAALAEEWDPIGWVIQERIKRELRRVEEMRESLLEESSTRMMALLRVFAQHKGPFWELARGELQALATAELFLEM